MILVVEDNEIVAAWLKEAIESLGRGATLMSSGEAALNLLGSDPSAVDGYSGVIVDLGLPGLSGVQTATFIRALPQPTCDIPIIALTGGRIPPDGCSPEQLAAASFDVILRKPLRPRQLELVLEAFITQAYTPPQQKEQT